MKLHFYAARVQRSHVRCVSSKWSLIFLHQIWFSINHQRLLSLARAMLNHFQTYFKFFIIATTRAVRYSIWGCCCNALFSSLWVWDHLCCVLFFSLISFTFFLTYIWIRNRARECLAVVCTCEILMSCAKPSSALTKCTSQSREVYISKYSDRVFLCAQIKPQNKEKFSRVKRFREFTASFCAKKNCCLMSNVNIVFFLSLCFFISVFLCVVDMLGCDWITQNPFKCQWS